jgi:hypothetical protein
MSKTVFRWRARSGEQGNLTPIIDLMELARETLKLNENAEFVITCIPEDGKIDFHIARIGDCSNIAPGGGLTLTPTITMTIGCIEETIED